jgi:AraC-like DNA-binding protein
LARLFQRETGMSFGRWRERARIAEALARLAEGDSVQRVAHALGYESPSAFTAMFRRRLGQPPQHYLATQQSAAKS